MIAPPWSHHHHDPTTIMKWWEPTVRRTKQIHHVLCLYYWKITHLRRTRRKRLPLENYSSAPTALLLLDNYSSAVVSTSLQLRLYIHLHLLRLYYYWKMTHHLCRRSKKIHLHRLLRLYYWKITHLRRRSKKRITSYLQLRLSYQKKRFISSSYVSPIRKKIHLQLRLSYHQKKRSIYTYVSAGTALLASNLHLLRLHLPSLTWEASFSSVSAASRHLELSVIIALNPLVTTWCPLRIGFVVRSSVKFAP